MCVPSCMPCHGCKGEYLSNEYSLNMLAAVYVGVLAAIHGDGPSRL